MLINIIISFLLMVTPNTAVRTEVAVQVVAPPPSTVPDWADCPEFYQMALDVGWPEDQMPTVMHVMHRESHCNPSAMNDLSCSGGSRSEPHARGLMQLCGWGCPDTRNQCLDPEANLTRSLELWQRSGWTPWCLRGDPYTPRC